MRRPAPTASRRRRDSRSMPAARRRRRPRGGRRGARPPPLRASRTELGLGCRDDSRPIDRVTTHQRPGGIMRHTTKGVAAAVMVAGFLLAGGVARAQIPLLTDVTNLSGFGAPLLAIINEVGRGDTANFELFADGQIDFAE